MIRKLICRTCQDGERVYLVGKDRCGWHQRHVWLVMRILGQCDDCNAPIQGEIVHAVTCWKSGEAEPGDWEQDFGEVIPSLSVKVSDSLTGGEE